MDDAGLIEKVDIKKYPGYRDEGKYYGPTVHWNSEKTYFVIIYSSAEISNNCYRAFAIWGSCINEQVVVLTPKSALPLAVSWISPDWLNNNTFCILKMDNTRATLEKQDDHLYFAIMCFEIGRGYYFISHSSTVSQEDSVQKCTKKSKFFTNYDGLEIRRNMREFVLPTVADTIKVRLFRKRLKIPCFNKKEKKFDLR